MARTRIPNAGARTRPVLRNRNATLEGLWGFFRSREGHGGMESDVGLATLKITIGERAGKFCRAECAQHPPPK